jgi:fructose-1,6-bisphosphatase/inositol monophosphatase family enzyme
MATAPADLLALLDDVAVAVNRAVARIPRDQRRNRTNRTGQYWLDLVADGAALQVLKRAAVRVVSEESGVGGAAESPLTVVLDPVDGSTNCARDIAYWATSLCVLDASGPLVGLVVNQATGSRTAATRGEGAVRDGVALRASPATHVEQAVVAFAGVPPRVLPWRQFRVLGCASLALCEVAAGGVDAYVDLASYHAPWDYLAGYLACTEAGAVVRDAVGEELVTDAFDARRQILAAGTSELLEALRPALGRR